MSDGEYVTGSLYFYAPNKGAAIFFTAAFLMTGGVHLWQTIHYSCWKLTPLFTFCALLFVVGFALRVYGTFHYDHLEPYIASLCITYAAPPLLELQNYHILGRILYYVPYQSPLHPGRVLTTFGFVSAIVEALNGWGAAYSVNQSLSNSQREAGHALIKTSLLLQIVVVAVFTWLALTFHRRCVNGGIRSVVLTSTLTTLYCSVTLIVARTIFRVVEYFGLASYNYNEPGFNPGSMTPLIRYEVFFYVFEGMTMICNSVMWNIRHPRRWLPRSHKIHLAEDGETEVEGQGYNDPRPFFQTLIDPFDIRGLIQVGKTEVN